MSTTEIEQPAITVARAPDGPPRRTRPLTQYWDYRTASWRTRDPVPAPRRGD